MAQIIIAQKMSGTGSIQDLASQNVDIVIDMGRYKFVVVGPDYYRLTATRHLSSKAAKKAVLGLEEVGYGGIKVLGIDGIQYHVEKWVDDLIPEDNVDFTVEA
jgi:hypothetical protein